MMASRITLLLLVTGLFAGMWSGDCAEERSVQTRLLARKPMSTSRPAYTSPLVVNRAIRSSVRPISQPRTERSCSLIPLPKGIAVGTYLVVDGRGRTETRVVTASEAFPDGRFSRHFAADQYTVRAGHERWHFIRLETPVGSLAGRRVLSASRTAPTREAIPR